MSDKEEKEKYPVEFISNDTHFLNILEIETIKIGNNNILSVAYAINYLCIVKFLNKFQYSYLIHICLIRQCLLNYNYVCIHVCWNYFYFSLAQLYIFIHMH